MYKFWRQRSHLWRSKGIGVFFKMFDVKVQVQNVPELWRQTFWKVLLFLWNVTFLKKHRIPTKNCHSWEDWEFPLPIRSIRSDVFEENVFGELSKKHLWWSSFLALNAKNEFHHMLFLIFNRFLPLTHYHSNTSSWMLPSYRTWYNRYLSVEYAVSYNKKV